MELIKLGNNIIALVISLALIIAHFFAPQLLRIRGIEGKRFTSFAGGVAIAYVFLHMLPELVEKNADIGNVLGRFVTLTPLLDLAIFFLALIGFNLFYGLELLVVSASSSNRVIQRRSYFLQLFMFGLNNFLISYTMPLRVQANLGYALIFSVTMMLHFTLVDRSFSRHFIQMFSLSSRIFLGFCLIFGWFIAVVTEPINVFLVALLIAFLAGSILFTAFREELPMEKGTSYIAFTIGMLLITILLLLEVLFTPTS